MKQIYGSRNWSKLWTKLEQSGNIGIDYCINPVLYPKICNQLNTADNAHVVDFGAGTNMLAIQFLFGNEKTVPALQSCQQLDNARKNVRKFTGIEQSPDLVKEAEKYRQELELPDKVEIQKMHLTSENKLPFECSSINLAVSRNFLMHLSIKDLSFHFDEVSHVLKRNGKYIFAILNPDYEQKKHRESNNGCDLKNGQRYSFEHGNNGENGRFYHYYKTADQYETIFNKHFEIVDKKACTPISDEFKSTHERYYWADCPMSYTYELRKCDD